MVTSCQLFSLTEEQGCALTDHHMLLHHHHTMVCAVHPGSHQHQKLQLPPSTHISKAVDIQGTPVALSIPPRVNHFQINHIPTQAGDIKMQP